MDKLNWKERLRGLDFIEPNGVSFPTLERFIEKEMEDIKAEGLNLLNSMKAEGEALLEKAHAFNPEKNPDAISLIKQKDGNWKGWMNKFGKVVEVREVGPETALQKLLTHDGK